VIVPVSTSMWGSGTLPFAFVGSPVALRGVYIPLITPFAADGSVALEAMEGLAHDYLAAGCAGLVPLGTTGEATSLDVGEKHAVVDMCARVCREHSAELIVGGGTNSTAATVAAVAGLADASGVTAAMCVVPYYVRPSQEGIVAHFRAVAAVSPVPVVVYNIPSRTGRLLESGPLLELARTANIAGVKQATPLDADTMALLAGAPDDFSILGGEDPVLFPLVLLGAHGAICASAHVCTERFVAMIDCALAGKVDEGRAHHEALAPVTAAAFAEPNPAVFKGVLHARGRIPTPDLRLPMTSASPAAIDRLDEAITDASR
jgi:4-hydroxy-tetrahydrodipicolinate synthase